MVIFYNPRYYSYSYESSWIHLLKFSYRSSIVDVVRRVLLLGLVFEVAASCHVLLEGRSDLPEFLLIHLHLLDEAALGMVDVRERHGRDAQTLVKEGVLLLEWDLDELDAVGVGEVVDQLVKLRLRGAAASAPFGVESHDGDLLGLVGDDYLVVLEGFDVGDEVSG